MAKETKTEYEEATRTVKKVKCDNCDETWDSRGNDGHNLFVLNVTIEERYGRSRWTERGFDHTSFYGHDYYRLNGDDVLDLCDPCLDDTFPDSAMVEVEEKDYYVDEKKVVQYSCDFCDESMGEDTDHTVTANPRVIGVEQLYGADNPREPHTQIFANSLNDRFQTDSYEMNNYSTTTDHDGQFDCCASCAGKLFGRKKSTSNNNSSSGFLKRLFGM